MPFFCQYSRWCFNRPVLTYRWEENIFCRYHLCSDPTCDHPKYEENGKEKCFYGDNSCECEFDKSEPTKFVYIKNDFVICNLLQN